MEKHKLGKHIVRYRKLRGISMKELAAQFGQGRGGGLCHFELGTRYLSDNLLMVASRRLQIPWQRLASPEQRRRWVAIAAMVGR